MAHEFSRDRLDVYARIAFARKGSSNMTQRENVNAAIRAALADAVPELIARLDRLERAARAAETILVRELGCMNADEEPYGRESIKVVLDALRAALSEGT